MQSTLKTLSIGLVMTGSLFIGNVATAADDGAALDGAALDGAALYNAKLCMTCHGAEGKAPIMPLYPKITGQSDVYLLQQMKDIRDGKRTNGMSVAMKASTTNVKDAEFEAIAKWLASLKSNAASPGKPIGGGE